MQTPGVCGARPEEDPSMLATSSTPKPLILVADDSAIVGTLVKTQLEDHAFNVVVVDRGDTALAIVPQLHPDLILLDMYMPGLDGVEVCRRLRADPATHELPVVLFSGQSTVQDRVDGL